MSPEDNQTFTHDTLDEGYDFFITDRFKERHHFKISTFAVPSGLLSEAIEVIDPEPDKEPRSFCVLSDFGTDIEKAELLLKEKIKKGINQRHLYIEDGKLRIGDRQQLIGRIEWDGNSSEAGFNLIFVIDGRRVTIDTFVELLEGYEGWDFAFKIYDPTDDDPY